MKELKILEQVAINNINFNTYQAMDFDGEFYYFCVKGKNVIEIYDVCFYKIKTCNVNREYGCISYNSKDKYFFAIPKYNASVIVKLDRNMQELGYIDITNILCNEDCIVSISYSCIDDNIILSSKNKVYKLSIKDNLVCQILELDSDTLLKVISVPPGYILITEETDIYILSIYDCKLNIVNKICFKKQNILYDAIFNPCQPYLNEKCDNYINIYMLMNTDKNCSNVFQIPIKYSEFNYELCKCNFKICKNKVEPCCSVDTSCIIETIALIQASIAHILNAEGEKIQKVLATSNNIDEILCVNKEVEQMIIKITHLEQVLYNSLVELENHNCCMNSCDSCCDDENKCICDIDGGNV